METFILDLSNADVGEIITIIRVQRFRLSLDAFAKKFNMTSSQLELIEDGKSHHGISLLKRLAAKYPKQMKVNLTVQV
jgi:transcriptional regulator with XRE-family HTH domain